MRYSDDQIVAALDVETTGLSAAFGDRVCEVGIVRARGNQIIDTYQALVNPQRPISAGAARVNGLSDEQVRGAPVFGEIAAQVLARLEGAALICHNAPFDLSFLDAELARLGLSRPAAGVFDTLDIARRYFRFPSNSLASLSRRLGVRNEQAHRALGDALTTYHVFHALCRQLAGRGVTPSGEAWVGNSPAVPAAQGAHLPGAIREALEMNRAIEITYLDLQGRQTCRRITPLRALDYNGSVHLVAYCHLRQAERSFRLDRIIAIEGAQLPSQD